MAAPDVVGRSLHDVMEGADGVAASCPPPGYPGRWADPTATGPAGRPAYLPARRMGRGVRLGADRLAGTGKPDEPDEPPPADDDEAPLADPEVDDGEEEGEEEDPQED